MKRFMLLLSFLAAFALAGCGTVPAGGLPPVQQAEIDALSAAILTLGADIGPVEAARAAQISFTYSRQLAREYQVSDSPVIHNIKVNQGLRPRGLCYQWADDLEARLQQEDFQTLQLHRAIAIANANTAFRLQHSTVIVSAGGDNMFQGLVLDPWRHGGLLYWGAVPEDTSYPWRPRAEVFEDQRRYLVTRQRWAG